MTPGRAAAILLSLSLPSLAAAAPPPRAVPVEVREVRPRLLACTVDATGSLEADERRICAEVAGVLRELSFEEGDRVEPGQLLATVDPETYALRAQKARAAHDRSAAQMREAENALSRRKTLRERNAGWVSEEELLQYEARLEEARAACEEARISWKLAEEDERRSRIRSPVAGKIERRHVVAGQFVQPGTPVAGLVAPAPLRLRLRVTALEAGRLREGQRVSFRIPTLAGGPFPAVLFHIAAQADPANRTVECLARVEAPAEALRPGNFAEIRIEVERKEGAIAVPESALLPTDRGYLLFVAEGQTARARTVGLGLHTADGEVEILSGLAAGERLVVRGASLLKDGAAISPAPAP